MKYLLDSSAIIKLTMGQGAALRARASQCAVGDIVTSTIAIAEVLYGSANEKPPPIAQLEAFMDEVQVLDFNIAAARAYAGLPFKRASYDRLIAAHALALGLTVVTDNTKDFADVPGLKVENWTI
ncbi:MAG: type II toxin-antitoxin system VapC family toxin [Novosphingobium sp.]|uniref:type II toxin-antitoxin system VapC family toxin n=1 Tax=Novosphingobium sp. TaxID=1874826 RepID=UPI0032B9E407